MVKMIAPSNKKREEDALKGCKIEINTLQI